MVCRLLQNSKADFNFEWVKPYKYLLAICKYIRKLSKSISASLSKDFKTVFIKELPTYGAIASRHPSLTS